MSDVIDTNVVEIRFDNSQFIENVSQTIDSVNTLKEALVFDTSSFDGITQATRSIDLSGVAANIESLSDRFSTFGIIGMTAVQRITNEVMTLAGKLGHLLSAPWRQLISGGTSRAENISNAQFQLQGIFGKTEEGARKLAMTMNADSKAIQEMTGYTEDMVVAMDAANYAVADTAYGLDSAAKAASVLATSGVDVMHFSEDLKDANGLLRTEMQVALRSISGTAAMANSTYDDVARVFERISGNGRIMAIDLQSLSARGLNAAATLRDYLNEVGVTVNATEQDIREMVTKGKIDFMTFAKAMDSAYGDHAKDANNTFNGAFSNMKFALSKIGADFISPLRDKLIPILNDVRMVINNIRKALQFKIKFPGTEQEVSVVELFTRAITHLTEAAHDMFAVWMGGQDVITKAMTGLSSITGVAFSDIKKVYKDVESGAISSSKGIESLINMASEHGKTLDEVYKTLAENLDKSEDEIKEMCRNGEISFEQFSNAISSAFGNTVWDKRVEQLATVFRNVLVTASNLANAVSSVIGPVIEAFISVFMGKGIDGVISFTQAMSDLTSNLALSVPIQKAIKNTFQAIFRILKSGMSIVGRLISAAFRILKAISPVIGVALDIVSAIAEVITEIIEFISYSEILNGVVNVLSTSLIILGRVALVIFRTVVKLVAPAINLMGQVFEALNKGIKSVKTKQVDNIIDRFSELLNIVTDGRMLNVFKSVITSFVGAIVLFFYGIVTTFKNIGMTVASICGNLSAIGDGIVEAFSGLADRITKVFSGLFTFLKNNWQSILAVVNSIISLGILTTMNKTGSAITKAIKAWANRTNAEGLLLVAKAIKQVAIAFVVMAGALLLMSMVDETKVHNVILLLMHVAMALTAVVFVTYLLVKAFGAWEKAKEKIDPIKEAMTKFLNALSKSVMNLSDGAAKFLKRVGSGVKWFGMAAFVIAFAGAIYILYQALKNYATIDWDTMTTGLKNMGLIMGALILSLSILGLTVKQAGGGFLGAAIAMLAFIAVLKAMEGIIVEYAGIKYRSGKMKKIFGEIAAALIIMSVAVGIMGATCKKAGFGLMGASVSMLALLVVLLAMKSLVEEYAAINLGTFLKAWFEMTLTLALFVGAIALMGDALGGDSSFSASLKNGIQFKNNAVKFMGVITTLLAVAIAFKIVVSTMDEIASAGFGAWLGTITLFGALLYGVSHLVKILGENKVDAKPLKAVAMFMFTLSLLFGIMTILDPYKMVAAAGSVSLIIGALAAMMERFPVFKKDDRPSKTIAAMITVLISVSAVIGLLANFADAAGMLAAAASVSMLLLSLSYTMKLLKGVQFSTEDFRKINGIIPLLLTLGIAVGLMNLIPVTDPLALISVAASMSALGLAVSAIVFVLSKVDKINKDAMHSFEIIMGVLAFAGFFIAGAAAIVGRTNSSGALWEFVGALTVLSAVVVALVFALNLINANKQVMTGVGAFSAIIGVMTGFVLLMSLFALIGDVNNTITLMNGLATVMTRMIPFLLIFTIVLSVISNVAPMAAVGALMFTILLSSIAGFAGILAFVTRIGDVNETIALMDGLVEAMNGLIGFLLIFSAVSALLGLVAPIAVAGVGVLALLIATVAEFALLMSLVALIPADTDKTVTIMEATSETLRSMSITLLILAGVAALAPLAIGGVTILQGMVVSILVLFGIVGAIKNIQNAVLLGINLILFSCQTLVETSEIMAGINLVGIATFLQAILLLGTINMLAITKIALAVVSLFAVTIPMALIGKQSNDILTGARALANMMMDLVSAFAMANVIGNTDLGEFEANVKKIVTVSNKLAAMSGLNVAAGLAKGMVDESSLMILKAASYVMADTIDNYFREAMGIHSPSIRERLTAMNIPAGILDAFTSFEAKDMLSSGTLDMADTIAESGVEPFRETGEELAKSLGAGLMEMLSKVTGSASVGIAEWSDHIVKGIGKATNSARKDLRDIRYWTSYYEKKDKEAQEKAHDQDYRPYSTANFNSTVGKDEETDNWWDGDWGNLFSFDSLFKEIVGDVGNLGAFTDLASGSMDGLADSMSGAGSAADELTSKIDDLMDEYEKRFDTAKERANKDLFKGVDKQGDDFLEKVQDIMDQYADIYTSAVEKTNGQDLFAEVKDEDESFAPETLLNNLEDQVNQVNELNTIISSLGGRIADNGLRAAISAMDVDDLPELRALYRMDDKHLREYEQLYQRKVQANQNKIQNELTGSLSQITGQYTNVATYVATDASTTALVRNLQSQIDQLNEYNTTVASLTGRIKDVNLREAIAHMGVESLDELKALNRMTDAQLDEYTAMYKSKISEEARVISTELSTELSTLLGQPVDISEFYMAYRGAIGDTVDQVSREAGKAGGQNIGVSTAEGMRSEPVKSASRETGSVIVSEVADGLEDKDQLEKVEKNAENIVLKIKNVLDPEKAGNGFRDIGGRIVFEIAKGMDMAREDSTVLRNSITSLAESICLRMNSMSYMFNNVGRNVVLGLRDGINNNASLATVASSNLAYKTLVAAKTALLVKSPSRAFMEIGRYVDEGFAIGLRNYANLATDEASDMAEGSMSAVQQAINQLSGMLDGSIDVNPVIKPTLDLSDVSERSAAIAGMFNNRQIEVQARADEQQDYMISKLGDFIAQQNERPNITFNQTNNSPKALNNTEIYRRTRNGFSQLVSAIQ